MARKTSTPRKRIFILETREFPEKIKEDLKLYGYERELSFRSSISKSSFRKNLPEDFDLYLLHISNTDEEAIEELRRKQSWSKIFIRTSMDAEIPFTLKGIVDGKYDISNIQYCEKVLGSVGARVKSWEEIYGEMN
jgi:hypothetical protein